MSPTAIVLILISAFIHAGWNLVCKRQHPSVSFFLVGNTIGTLCLLPILFYFRAEVSLIPPTVWWLLILTGFFMTLYYTGLAGAYRNGDMSIAYPLARSLPIFMVAATTHLLGQGRPVSALATVGFLLVAGGCFFLPLQRFREFRWKNYRNHCCFLALAAAVGTAGYTIVDDRALSLLRALPDKPFNAAEAAYIYMTLEAIVSCLWLVLATLAFKDTQETPREVLRSAAKPAAVMGIGIYLAYGLILTAMAYVTNVSYVAAFRQVSILIGAVLGVTILREPRYLPKQVGVVTISLGLILIGIG